MILDIVFHKDHMFEWGMMTTTEISMMISMLVMAGILALLIVVFVCRFVHNDAVRRDVPSPVLWVFIVLIFNIAGLIIYLLVRGSYEGHKTEHTIRPTKQYYTYYTPVQATQVSEVSAPVPAAPVKGAKFCAMCGMKVDREGSKFCPRCGNKI